MKRAARSFLRPSWLSKSGPPKQPLVRPPRPVNGSPRRQLDPEQQVKRDFLRQRSRLSRFSPWKQPQVRRRRLVYEYPRRNPDQDSQEAEPSFLLDRTRALQLDQLLRAPANPLRVSFRCPPDKQPHLDLFNLYLLKSLADPTHRKTSRALWRLYLKLQLTSPDFLRALSPKAWNILWRTQSLRTLSEPKIVSHLTKLAEDMQSVGHAANFEQRLVQIETLFGQGNRDAAIEKWHQRYQTPDRHKPAYLELGVRMHAVAGDVALAQDLLVELCISHPTLNPRLIMYVFDAHMRASGQDESHVKKAWALYLYLKRLLGDDMAVKDYETCYTGFLNAGYGEHAIAVFRDQMAAQGLRGPDGYKANASILKGYNDLTSLLRDADQLNQMFLSGLSSLPRSHQNKFFFGKWINRLVELGHVDSAAKVYELMYERDVLPQARHLDALIGGWAESRDPANMDKAEHLALQMIVKRVTEVRRHKGWLNPTTRTLPENLEPRDPLFLNRPLPPATSETFAFLRQIYLQRGEDAKLESLYSWQVMHAARATTTEALNMQLSFYLERGRLRDVWRTFERDTLRRPSRAVKPTSPDLGTFTLLWEASAYKQRMLGRSSPYLLRSTRMSFPPPSVILRHTLSWVASLPARNPKAHAAVLAALPESRIPNHVVWTYTVGHDLSGCIVAMHALHRRLGSPVTQHTAMLSARALARVGFPKSDVRSRAPVRRRQLNSSIGLQYNLDKVLSAMHILLLRQIEASSPSSSSSSSSSSSPSADETPAQRPTAGAEGDDGPDRPRAFGSTSEAGADTDAVLLEALSDLTRAVLLRRGDSPAAIEARIRGTKRSLGLERDPDGDPDYDHRRGHAHAPGPADPAFFPTGNKNAWQIADELGLAG